MRGLYDPWFVVFVIALMGAGLAALTVLCNAMFPDFVRRAHAQVVQRVRGVPQTGGFSFAVPTQTAPNSNANS